MIASLNRSAERSTSVSCAAIRLSVIVPFAVDETEGDHLLEQLQTLPVDCEILAVRAGSRSLPLPVLPRGDGPAMRGYLSLPARARQMNAGAKAARGRWLWFLHADSRLHAGTLDALHGFLARDRDALGFFDLRYRDGPWLSRINEHAANLRARALGLPFGDQGFVLPARWFARLGRYDEDALYGEDHLLVWRARQYGLPLQRIRAPLTSSARKYAANGWLATTWLNLRRTFQQARPEWKALRGRRAKRRNCKLQDGPR